MNNLTNQLDKNYVPQKALLFYSSESSSDREEQADLYIESYDIGKGGRPINAHPLSQQEMVRLCQTLQSATALKTNHWISSGLMPANVLHLNCTEDGFAVWHTPPQKVSLFFVGGLGIPCGMANVPALLWKATKDALFIYALKQQRKPTLQTPLHHAPFFNIYQKGNVCMGTVKIDTNSINNLEDFIAKWESYFWNSYFSHLLNNVSPVKENIVQLWQRLVDTDAPFPVEVLQKNALTLSDILS